MNRRNKHNARSTRIDGIYFPSQLEANRYKELKLLEKAGEIEQLVVHPRYPIVIKDQHICFVVLDFAYWDFKKREQIHLDTKGWQTSESKLRHKLWEAFYAPDKITIVRKHEKRKIRSFGSRLQRAGHRAPKNRLDKTQKD
jgi:hypothetical protein